MDEQQARKALRSWARRWKNVSGERDPLLRAVIAAGISKTEIHITTGIARSTIDRATRDERQDTMTIDTGIKPGDRCEACGVDAEERACSRCGARAVVIDCGHHAQPAPISASSSGEALCDSCAQEG